MKCNLCGKESDKFYINSKNREPICIDCAHKILDELNSKNKNSICELFIEDVFIPWGEDLVENNLLNWQD